MASTTYTHFFVVVSDRASEYNRVAVLFQHNNRNYLIMDDYPDEAITSLSAFNAFLHQCVQDDADYFKNLSWFSNVCGMAQEDIDNYYNCDSDEEDDDDTTWGYVVRKYATAQGLKTTIADAEATYDWINNNFCSVKW
jgi:hypothetical protein